MLFRKTMIKRYRNSEACGRSLAWTRTSACHADDPGSNPGGRTILGIKHQHLRLLPFSEQLNAVDFAYVFKAGLY